jgi:hypothetical protein
MIQAKKAIDSNILLLLILLKDVLENLFPNACKDRLVQVRSDKHRKDDVLPCLGYTDSAVR